jgi:hypothetical protein
MADVNPPLPPTPPPPPPPPPAEDTDDVPFDAFNMLNFDDIFGKYICAFGVCFKCTMPGEDGIDNQFIF